jgi:hypothetical protein
MEKIVEEVQLRDTNKVTVTLSEYKGKLRLDVRHWFRENPLDQEWIATKKGINIGEDAFGEFRKALDRVFSKLTMADGLSDFSGGRKAGGERF